MSQWVLLLFVSSSIIFVLSETQPRLLIISLDGFSHEYLSRYSLPTLNKFRDEGVHATHGMRPTFTTMTFPNHISIATGMYVDDHGIIHNKFIDRSLKKTISMSSRDEGQWSDPKVEPLWITATKQHIRCAVLFWPGCHNHFNGIRPLIYSWSYTDAIPFREKIDNSISYFTQLQLQLVMLYHYEPDKQGHIFGPNSLKVHKTLNKLDNDVKYLLNRVKNELDDDLNIMFVSDHGMTQVKQVIRPFLDGYIDRSMVKKDILSGAFLNVIPHAGKTEEVIEGLSRIPNVSVYTLDTLPDRFHYSKPTNRLGKVFVIPNEEGIVFSIAKTNSSYSNKGNHGWDNTFPSMQALFMAHGPSFNQQIQIDSLNNVDIYHIACRILDLTPNPFATAGSLNNLTNIFRPIPKVINGCSLTFLSLFSVLFMLLLNF